MDFFFYLKKIMLRIIQGVIIYRRFSQGMFWVIRVICGASIYLRMSPVGKGITNL